MAADRFEELKAKARAEGLTDDEAAELGRLYAERSGEPDADENVGAKDAAEEDEESDRRRELEAGAEAQAAQERARSQVLRPGGAREPDYETPQEGDK